MHEYNSTAITATYGTPWRFWRLKIAGAPPRSESAWMARLVAKTAALPVEKTEMKMRALIKEGKTGISNRFMAEVRFIYLLLTTLTDDVGRLCGTWCSCRNSAQKIRVVGCRVDANAQCAGNVKEQDSINSRVKSFRHDTSWRFDFSSNQRNPIRSSDTILVNLHPSVRTYAKQHQMRASKTPFILKAGVSPTKGPGDFQNLKPYRSF